MTINVPLLPHQQKAVDRLKKLRVGALYMEKGCGKTRVILELICLRVNAGKIERALWLCPCDSLHLLRAKIASMTDLDERFLLYGIETLSYNLSLTLRLQKMAQRERFMLVLDGGELIKNPFALRTIRATALARLCSYRLLTSETPLTRSIEDMYAPWRLLDWRILGYQSYWSFSLNHLDLKGSRPAMRAPRNVDYLLRRIEPYTFQALRIDCLLPDDASEYVWQFRLSPEIMSYYRAVIQKMLASVHEGGAGIYRLLLACQQMSSGRSVTSMKPLSTVPLYAHPLDNPRIQALLDVLSHFPDQRTLILCRFTYEVEDVLNALTAVYGANCCRAYVRSHRPRDNVQFLVMNRLCSLPWREKECDAPLIIHYSHDWDWRKRRQSERRLPNCSRKIVNLVAVNTIDEKILDCLNHKQHLIQLVRSGLTALLSNEV